ncbi:MAG: transporter, periplasmic binding component, putative Fe3+ transport system [Nitrospira sp.]|jgi:iron(III) transport system substrate-binding protein|nr:transporter, periplasmic binding component, putative Fe3+ transport system [Nitrospira sp.]
MASFRRVLLALTFILGIGGLSQDMTSSVFGADKLVVYSGRAERLIKPVLDEFQSKSGIQIELLSSGTTELVNRLQAEGDHTPADVFLTNDAGSLEHARELKLLRPMNMREVERAIPAQFRASDNSWIGLSGRFWIVVYNTHLVKPDQIKSLLDLAQPQWKDKIAIPNSGSEYLQAGVSVIKATFGEDRTKQFLQGLKTNAGSQVYQKSSQIVEAVAKGQVAVGIVNHYYIYRHLAAQPSAPIAALMPDQQEGGMGAIMNVSGIGVTRASKHVDNAKLLLEFLVAQAGQKLFADLDKEYPLHPDVKADPALVDRHAFRAALVPLARLAELREPTLTLIEQVGLR